LAEYSRGGKYLGILSNLSLAEQNALPAPAAQAPTEDDGPDCTGGSLALILQNTKTKQLVDVPFPKGFDTVLDFSFSPDENMIAVTYGVVGCDYPGDKAQVFLVNLPDLKLTLISPEDRLSVKPVWTPDGKAIVYSDYTGSDSPLAAFDLATHKVTKLTTPGQFGPDNWIGWR
jgi:Tol biopolymer transport system component